MSRTKKFSMNALSSALQQIVVMAAGFVTPALMIRTYGSEVNGLISSINQIIAYLSLVEAGLSGAAVYSLYKPLARQDHAEINSISSAAKNFYFRAGYLFSVASLVMACVYSILKSTPTLLPKTVFILAVLLSINGCVDFFIFARYRSILTADQRTYVISTITIIQTVIKTTVIIVCSAYNVGLIELHLLALSPIVVKLLFLPRYCRRCYPYLSFSEKPNNQALSRRYDVIYQQILGVVQAGAPAVIATVFLDWIAVSVYSIYNMVVGGINGILSVFISGLPAAFGEIIVKENKAHLRMVVSQFEVAYYYILSIAYGLTFALILPFIAIYTGGFGDANYYIPSLAILVVFNGLVYNIKTPQSMLIISAGMYRETRWRVTVQGLIILVGGCILVNAFGLQGIMIASIVSNIYRTVDLLYFAPLHITGERGNISAVRMLKVIGTIIIIVLPSVFMRMAPAGYFAWCGYAVGYGIYAILVTTIVWFATDRREFTEVLQRVWHMLKRS